MMSGPGRTSRFRTAGIAILAVVIAAVAAAVVLTRRGPEAGAPSGAAPAPVPTALRPAPDLQITMYQGQDVVGGDRIRLSQLWRRGRPVVLNFFAGLCPPCRAEMPDFQRFYAQGAKNQVFLISVDIGPFIGLGSREEGRALLQELGITFPAGTVFEEDVVFAYQILGMPTTVFITTDGRILRKHSGLLTFEQMRRFTEQLVQVSKAR